MPRARLVRHSGLAGSLLPALAAQLGGVLFGAGVALAATVAPAPVFYPWYATWPLTVPAATWSGPRPRTATIVLLPAAVVSALVLPGAAPVG